MLNGKNAIVTGSTSGIGLAIASELAHAGANVTLNGLGDADAIEATRAGLERTSGTTIRFSGANMLRRDEIVAMVNEAEAELGSVDILVNNAGIQYVSPIEDFPADTWETIIAINLSATFHAVQAAVPGMKQRGWGRIINTGSAHALVASPFKSAYVAAKHGIAGLTKVVALELAEHGTTVNTICPGYVLTPLVESQIPDTARARGITEDEVKRDVLLAAQPTKEFVKAEEIAAYAVFLCSDAARSITGAVLPIDGGWTSQ
jgi:3-hydroxybutyrate dehydrogenase